MIRIGCSGWNYASWRADFYPQGLPASRWLEHYSSVFDTVEVNSTFYRLARRDAVARWVTQTPAEFRFAVKSSRTSRTSSACATCSRACSGCTSHYSR